MESTLFRRARALNVRLIETLGWDGAGLPRLDLHMMRLAVGARNLGYPCDLEQARAALIAEGLRVGQGARARLRMTVGAAGDIEVTSAPMPQLAPFWRIGVSAQRLNSADPFLRVKSTHRPAYDAARAQLPLGLDEVILLNERGEVADGSITTLFFDLGQGLRTPPLSSGALPGVLRTALAYPEESIRAEVLSKANLWVGNSLRGLIPAQFVHSQ